MKIALRILLYTVLIGLSLLFLVPLVFAFLSSMKNSNEIFQAPLSIPEVWRYDNYFKAWNVAHFNVYFINTMFLTVLSMFVTATVSVFGCYILAKYKFKLNGLLYMGFIAGLMVPGQLVIIPLAVVFGYLKLHNNYGALILLITAFNIPMSTLILTGFIRSLPNELEEAAIMDGCRPIRFVLTILVPLMAPALASVSIFNFLSAWNNLLFPLVFIGKDSLKTISIGLLSFVGIYSRDYGGQMAGIMIAIVVPILAYVLLQEKVEKGLTGGAVKG